MITFFFDKTNALTKEHQNELQAEEEKKEAAERREQRAVDQQIAGAKV